MKRLFSIVRPLALILPMALLFSCKKDVGLEPVPTEQDICIHNANTGVELGYDAVILGGCDDDMKESLESLLPKVSATVTDKTRLLIVPALDPAYEKDLTRVYENCGIIAVVNPTSDNVERWFSTHDWYGAPVAPDLENALIFSFNWLNHNHIVFEEDTFDDYLVQPKDEDEVEVEEGGGEDFFTDLEDDYNDLYSLLSLWIEDVGKDLDECKLKVEGAEVKTDSEKPDDVKNIFNAYHYSYTFNDSAKKKVRQLLWSDPDYISGNMSVTFTFDIHQIHSYETNVSPGDYYLVDMTASIANSDMYKGKWWNRHGGCYVRICGMYCQEVEFDVTPVDAVTQKPLSDNFIYFTSSGTPSPEGVVGATNYESSSSFSLNTDVSVSPSISKKGPAISGNAKISMGWTWSNKETRSISDMDIVKTGSGNKVGYKLVYNNLPKFDWGSSRGFDEGSARSYRSTTSIRSFWVWRVPSAADNSTAKPISLRISAKPKYGAMSFLSTKADLDDFSYDDIGKIEYVFPLQDFIRDICGDVQIENKSDFPISNIRLYKADEWNASGEEAKALWSFNSILNKGESIKSPASYKTADKYVVTFTSVDNTRKFKSKELTLIDGGIQRLFTDESYFTSY